jgi:glucokinase
MDLIGVDIGGSHIAAARVIWKGDFAETTDFHEADIHSFGSAENLIESWSEVIRRAIGSSGQVRLGIAMPGPFDYAQGISLIKDQGKMKSLLGLSVKQLLGKSLNLPEAHISFSNDAAAFLLGESLAGAGSGFQNSMGLTLGTGLGSAIKIHEVVTDAKLWTAPFREGIAEDYLGTAWFREYTLRKFGLSITGVKDLLLPEFDPEIAKMVFSEFGKSLGEFLSFYVIRFQCQGVVLGGKIARAADWFLPATQAYLDKLDYPLEIRISQLEEKAALIGSCLPFISSIYRNQS